ncbi:MAG: IPExxxVDY family protein [Cyclobacteriaceae bacterium]|nr:IPExxxVDY family protein [Cyclobacteriaceae bacterium]
MKKKKLEAEIHYDFSLFGIISPMKEYKIAWWINKLLEVGLVKAKDVEIDFLKIQNLLISNFVFETEHSTMRLIKNKSVDSMAPGSAYLMPELHRFDYLIMINGFEATITTSILKEKLSQIPQVQFVQKFDIEDLRSRENLIF